MSDGTGGSRLSALPPGPAVSPRYSDAYLNETFTLAR